MEESVIPSPGGQFAATLTIGAKGQIVIPKGARELFGFNPGDQVLLLADKDRGIAILPIAALQEMFGSAGFPPEGKGPQA